MNFEEFTADLPGKPLFREVKHYDVNPLSGQRRYRLVHDPNEAMRIVHERFLRFLYLLPAPGINPGRIRLKRLMRRSMNPFKNMCRHETNRYFYTVDLKDAFPSVDLVRLAHVLAVTGEWHGLDEGEAEAFLRTYCSPSHGSGLVVGAPSSNALFECYAGRFIDELLAPDIKRWEVTYTRLTDDLTFSAGQPLGVQKRRRIRSVVDEAGFSISHRKSKLVDSARSPIFINGLGLRWKTSRRCNEIFVPRSYVRKLSGLVNAGTEGRCSMAVLHGHMSPFLQIAKREGVRNQTEAKLMRDYRKLVEAQESISKK